jgi:hypothetical protein
MVAATGETPSPKPQATGWMTEPNASIHRASATACDSTNPELSCKGTERVRNCETDADCKDGPHGRCVTQTGQVGPYCGCHYSCESDKDCKADQACVCNGLGSREPHSVCAPATCTTDADCKSGACGLAVNRTGCGERVSLACRTKDDTCTSDTDCNGGGGGLKNSQCLPQASDAGPPRWACSTFVCAVGRPLVVSGETRVAEPSARGDWALTTCVDARDLDAHERARVANHYLAMGALEHASVASFARFSLALMTKGAPPELVAETHAAAADEVRHAQMAYGVAASILGRDVGPGRLEAAALPIEIGIASIAEALVLEGCVGETIGAREASVVASDVLDPALREALLAIARDEERHATLAWRQLAWMIGEFGEVAREAALRGFARAEQDLARPVVDEKGVPAFGLASPASLARLRSEVFREVIVPCREAMGLAYSAITPAVAAS